MRRWTVKREPGPRVPTLLGRPCRWSVIDPSGVVVARYYRHDYAIRDAQRYARQPELSTGLYL